MNWFNVQFKLTLLVFYFFYVYSMKSQAKIPGQFGDDFEGDMVFINAARITAEMDAFRPKSKWLWPDGDVYYRLASTIKKNATKVSMIKDAMSEITEEAPCINFIDIEKNIGNTAVFVDIVTHGDSEHNVSGLGCQSEVGYQGRRQIINLQPEGCFDTATIKHQLFHTLGSVHEFSRPDVDLALEIFLDNVKSNKTTNFIMKKYDERYMDIMQYPSTVFALNDQLKIMKANDPYFRHIFGYIEGFSIIDIIELNLTYNCTMTAKQVFRYVTDYMDIVKSWRRMDQNKMMLKMKQLDQLYTEIEQLKQKNEELEEKISKKGNLEKMGNLLKVDCIWSSWSSYSGCSTTTCGEGGTKTRTRSIQQQSQAGGDQCTGGTSQFRKCGCVLVHSDSKYRFYRVPITSGSKIFSSTVLTTCNSHGLVPQCYDSDGQYVDSHCVAYPGSRPPTEMAKILCNIQFPTKCPAMDNMFWYLNNFRSGSAYGVTQGSAAMGKDFTSTSNSTFFASCLKPI